MKDIAVGVIGCQGRMGTEIINILEAKSIKTITNGGEKGGDKNEIFKNSDVVIDFTNTLGLTECLEFVEKYRTPFLSGSTPMTDDVMKKILLLSQKSKICWSSNTSIGVSVVKKISSIVGKMLVEYDCEIVEKHHNKKKDAPSGTAISIGQSIADARNVNFNDVFVFGRKTERKNGEIGFSSVRGGNIFGEHDVMFIGENDEITISHKAYNRKLFAIGAVECALKLLQKDANGFYTVEDLLF